MTLAVARAALAELEVDEHGLDAIDRQLLTALVEKFGGGPVGLDTMAAMIAEDAETIADVYEPFLLQEGFLRRTPQGRVATERTYAVLGKRAPSGTPAGTLFSSDG